MGTYRANIIVRAVQWREDNLDEVRALLKDYIPNDWEGNPAVYAEWIEPYFISSLGDRGGYYMLTMENDEADPGQWVVLYQDGEIEIMNDEQFTKMFEVA